MKLSPEREAELLNEMALAEIFTEKAWQRRYGVKPRTIRRLRAKMRERFGTVAALGPDTVHVLMLNGSRKRA
ncbi:MAG TPA: hypothetical protein VHW71_18710 [Steroidobacteraceae bacterium]|nr:hypothetical protein [Steroidobacteraceae bacterium]